MERLQDRFRAAHTQVLGVSIDSKFSHAGWAKTLGGISFPLLADFHPKGAMAKAYGLYLDDAGITDRATVIIDANGVVQHASSVTPAGERNIEELAALCEEVDKKYEGTLDAMPKASGLEGEHTLYVKSNCGFSAWTLQAMANLHLEDKITVKNVTEDASAMAALKAASGAEQAPCLVVGGKALADSAAIIEHMVKKTAALW